MIILERANNSSKHKLRCSQCGEVFEAFLIGTVECPWCSNYRFAKDIFDQSGGHAAVILKNNPGECRDAISAGLVEFKGAR